MALEIKPPSKPHQILFPQDARRVFIFPDTNGKIANETSVRDMVKSDSKVTKQIRRKTIITAW